MRAISTVPAGRTPAGASPTTPPANAVGAPPPEPADSITLGQAEMRAILQSRREDDHVAWRYKAPSDSCQEPSIAKDGSVYLTDGHHCIRLDRQGNEKWQCASDRWTPFRPQAMADGGVAWCPSGKSVQSWDADGNPRWTWGEGCTVQSIRPSVDDQGRIYVCVRRGEDRKPALVALAPEDGRELWSAPLPMHASAPPLPDGHGGVFVRCDDDRLVSIDPVGRPQWDRKLPERLDGRPGLAADGSVWIANDNGQLFRVSPKGEVQPMLEARGAIRGEPLFDPQGRAFVASHDHHVYAVKPGGGEAWRFEMPDLVEDSVALLSDGTVLVADRAGHLQALDPDGHPLWNETFEFPPNHLAVDRHTAYLTGRNEVVAIRPGGVEADLEALAEARAAGPAPEAPTIERQGEWIVVGGIRLPVKGSAAGPAAP